MDFENPYTSIFDAIKSLGLPSWGTALVLCFVIAAAFGMKPFISFMLSMAQRRRRETEANATLLTAENMRRALDLASKADRRAIEAMEVAGQAMSGLAACQLSHSLCEERLRLSRNHLLEIIQAKPALDMEPPEVMWERIDREAEAAVRGQQLGGQF